MVKRRRSVQDSRRSTRAVLRRPIRPVLRRPVRPVLCCGVRSVGGDARRVLSAFVKLRCEGGKPMSEVFDASHVERLLRSGQSDDAHYYLERFLLHVPRGKPGISPVASQLLAQVSLFKTLATVAGGGEDGAVLAAMFENPSEYTLRNPAAARLHRVIALMKANPLRASELWQKLQPEKLNRIMDLVSRCPELQGDVRLPRKRTLLWDPITHGLCKCPSRCRKTTNTAPSDVLVREFLQTRLLMTQGRNGSGVPSSASSSSLALGAQIEHNAPEPIILVGQPVENLERAPEKQDVLQV